MIPVGFEPKISAGEGPQTYALDRAATGTAILTYLLNYLLTYLLHGAESFLRSELVCS